MLYVEYINKAIEATVVQAENGLFYVEPLWKSILLDNELNSDIISDIDTNWNDILDVLKLAAEKQNTINSNKPYITNWLHEIITTVVDPSILQEETDYMKNITEYLKANKEAQKLKEN